jgi:hypothetical protein
MPSHQQVTAARNIRNVFLEKRLRYAMLNARCQAGKTGAFQELIRLMLGNGDVNRVYILCGSNETELRDQAHADTKAANPAAYAAGLITVLFRQDFKSIVMDITRTLIVVDESHLDQGQNQQLDQFLARHGLSMDGNPGPLETNDTFIVSVDATPYSELSAMSHKESYQKHVEVLAVGSSYFGLAEYKYRGLINPTYDLSRSEESTRFTEMCRSMGPKYGLMRFSSSKASQEQLVLACAAYLRIGGQVFFFTAEKEEISIASMITAPTVPTLIIIRGRLRAGKVVPKQHISFVWEDAETSKTDSLLQGLLGRMCGYPVSETNPYGYGDTMPLIFVPKAALARCENKVVKASEIERAIMDYPLAIPTKGTNLRKEHIATRPANGKTQCPPLRLTWDAEGDEWTPPTAEDGDVGEYCRAFLLAHENLLNDAPFSIEQKTEIMGFIATAYPHTRTLQTDPSASFKKYFSEVIASYESKTAVAENVTDCPPMTFFITKDAILPNSNRRHLYVIFYTDVTNGTSPSMMAVDLKSRIPRTNGKSIFSIHAQQVDRPLVAGGVVGIDETKIRAPVLLESALREYVRLYKESSLTVARCIQSNQGRFTLSREAFHYVSPKQNDVEVMCARLGRDFRVKMKIIYARSGVDSFNIKKIVW